jgi:hypothetical protein
LGSREIGCSNFSSGFTFISYAGTPSANVTENVDGPTDAAGVGWRGGETLLSYPGDGARSALEAIRKSVAKCPASTNTTTDPTRYALAAGTGTGDESLTVTARRTKPFGRI